MKNQLSIPDQMKLFEVVQAHFMILDDEDMIRWAEQKVEELDDPDIWYINIACSNKDNLHDAMWRSWVEMQSSAPDDLLVFRASLGLLHRISKDSSLQFSMPVTIIAHHFFPEFEDSVMTEEYSKFFEKLVIMEADWDDHSKSNTTYQDLLDTFSDFLKGFSEYQYLTDDWYSVVSRRIEKDSEKPK